MKKSLIALAVLAASGAAMAQSSVTMFGVVDLGVSHYSVEDGVSQTAMSNGGLAGSRLGFRGVEDLGGGLTANFHLEGALTADNGKGGSSGGGFDFQRRSTVGLGGAFGEVRLGRDYTPTFWNDTVFDPFGTSGVGGNVVSTARGGLGNANYVRANNSINYFLPGKLGGFYGQAMYAFDEALSTTAGSPGRYAGARLGYANGPVDVAIAYGKTDGATPPTAAAPDVKSWNLGASYNLGIVKLMGEYARDKVTVATTDTTTKGFLLGLTAPVGPGEVKLAYSRAETEAAGSDPRSSKLAVGYVYNLSKRTAVYASAARLNNDNGATRALGGLTGVANKDSTGYDFGLRHSF